MKKVLFLYTGFLGHLYRTHTLQRYYLDRGFHVEYIIFSKTEIPFGLPGVKFTYLKQEPFYRVLSGYDKNMIDHTKQKIFELGEVLRKAVSVVKPDILFVDEFCTLDLMLLLPWINDIFVMVLSPFLPSYPNTFFPPQFLFEFPGDHNLRIWEDLVRSESDKLKSKREFILNCYLNLGLPSYNRIWAFNQIHPSYSNISKGYFADKEIDFGGQILQSWEHYLGPMVRTESNEKDHKLVDLFISHALNKKKKIIYVSLGTVINSLLSNNMLVCFFSMIFNIASTRTDWIFIVKLPKSTCSELKLKSINVLMVNYSPQLKILRHADLMVTHGGGSSVYEALYQEVPMLIIPPIDIFDYNGNAARMVHLGVGKHMTLHDNQDTLEYNIAQILLNPEFKLNAVKWSSYFNRNYPPDYLGKMDFIP